MNISQHSDLFEKLGRFGFQAMGYVFMAGLAVILIVAWVFIESLFQLFSHVAHRGKTKPAALKWKITNKGQGMALLLSGMALIFYTFAAPDPAGSEVSRAFAGAPTEETMCLLLGGSAAVVVGVTVALHSFEKKRRFKFMRNAKRAWSILQKTDRPPLAT